MQAAAEGQAGRAAAGPGRTARTLPTAEGGRTTASSRPAASGPSRTSGLGGWRRLSLLAKVAAACLLGGRWPCT